VWTQSYTAHFLLNISKTNTTFTLTHTRVDDKGVKKRILCVCFVALASEHEHEYYLWVFVSDARLVSVMAPLSINIGYASAGQSAGDPSLKL